MPLGTEEAQRKWESSLYSTRLVELIKLLNHEALSAPQITERLHAYYPAGLSGARRVRADIRQLREWGFVIEPRRNPARYELLHNPLATPLDDEQIDALATLRDSLGYTHPFAPAINGLLKFLTANLDETKRERYEQVAPLRLALTTATNYDVARPLLQPLTRAIRAREQVQFSYRSLTQRDTPLQHTVDPYIIEFYQQHIYLVAYSQRTRQLTDFRLDQIVVNSFKPLHTPIQQARDLYPYHFRYWLSATLVRRGISERFHDQQVVQHFPDGSVEIAARARAQFYALRGLLRYAENARATHPPELVAEVKATLDAMRAGYGD